MPSPAAEALMEAMRTQRGAALETTSTLADIRDEAEHGVSAPEVPGVVYEEVDAGGVPAVWILPETVTRDRVVQYLHGGGYMIGSARAHSRFTAHLASAVGCVALSVDYRLAPEHPFPAQLEDSVACYQWLLDQGIEPQHVAIAGDSAGGALTLSTLLKLRDDGVPIPAAGVALSPWSDMAGTAESFSRNADVDPGAFTPEVFKRFADAFLQGHDATDPYASPLYGDFEDLPPLYIQAGADEMLVDDSSRVAERAAAAGVDVDVDLFPEMWHVFQLSVGTLPEADDAVARIGTWLRERFDM
jgi:monoterpene epsilon-lactone hydrolase